MKKCLRCDKEEYLFYLGKSNFVCGKCIAKIMDGSLDKNSEFAFKFFLEKSRRGDEEFLREEDFRQELLERTNNPKYISHFILGETDFIECNPYYVEEDEENKDE